ncbi:hypothetical protein R3P38DRAFT_2778666 [Favolaschia claudopus]|uniref:Uncharacterized protein n=1 Tax=Favolaschia claudopus TaxID=2862362 RepID=A0AAW0BHN8_9AGAR
MNFGLEKTSKFLYPHDHHASFPTSPPSRLNRSQSTPSYRARSLCSAQDSQRSKGWRRMTREEVVGQAIILFDDDRAFNDLSNWYLKYILIYTSSMEFHKE